ncbi:ribokinase [Thiothrix nivea]|uniref:Ribokinase n=1 Tax=Thiothrix nivea (strain ATCC 35100 / DSM 5205 / JP2) TaxID=870187 RepID=A0A656HF17_THINJ|nr:ribokinase [Thiothrix nivea]EIJ35518.1 PfkB domain protein [Thiothrix nivea DSM 5205]
MDVFVLGSYINANSLRVGQLPKTGESVQASEFWAEHGGKGLNLAVGMHRLGLQAHTLLAIGNDAAGAALLDLLHAEGMDTSLVLTLPDASGFGVGLVAEDGSNIIAIYPGANAKLDGSHVKAASPMLTSCQLVCAQFEIPDAPIREAFQQARQQDITTLLNPSPWRTPDPEMLALTDILVLNETEAAACFGLADAEALSIIQWLRLLPTLAWRGRLLVVTLAGRGCVVRQGETAMHEPAWTVTVTDPTGAGDAFTAGLAYALGQNTPLNAALRFANACGAIVASQAGVLSALPALTHVQAFMQGQACADSSAR